MEELKDAVAEFISTHNQVEEDEIQLDGKGELKTSSEPIGAPNALEDHKIKQVNESEVKKEVNVEEQKAKPTNLPEEIKKVEDEEKKEKEKVKEVNNKKKIGNLKKRLDKLRMKLAEELKVEDSKQREVNIFTGLFDTSSLKNEIEIKLDPDGASILSAKSANYKELITSEFPDNDMMTRELSIKVLEAKILEAGFFSSSTVEYVIETQPYNWQVCRRYHDCINLRKQLKLYFPGLIIPPLNKKYDKEKTDRNWIQEASAQLQGFFNELINNPIIRSSEMIWYFLSLTERTQFVKKTKGFNKGPSWKDLRLLMNIKGRANIEVTERVMKESDKWIDYSNIGRGLCTALIKSMADTSKMMEMLSNKLQEDAKLLNAFGLLYDKVGGEEIAAIFKKLRDMVAYLGKIKKLQANIVKKKIGKFFECYQEELTSISEATDYLKAAKKNFQGKLEELRNQKEKMFKECNVSAWGISVDLLGKQTDISINKALAFPLMLPEVSL